MLTSLLVVFLVVGAALGAEEGGLYGRRLRANEKCASKGQDPGWQKCCAGLQKCWKPLTNIVRCYAPEAWQATGTTCSGSAETSGFTKEEAKVYASLSQTAYCAGKTDAQVHALKTWTCGPCQASGLQVAPGSVRTARVGLHDMFAYTARLTGPGNFTNKCVVGIRGSVNLRNWIEDVQFGLHPVPFEAQCKGCKVEVGFLKVWEGLKPEIVHNLKMVGCAPGKREVVVVGHSLGGAAGILGMMSLHSMGFKVNPGMVFESPRVGNLAFKDAFKATFGVGKFWRVTRRHDPFPMLPFIAMGFHHVDSEAYIAESGAVTVCLDSESKSCARRNEISSDIVQGLGDHCLSTLVPTGRICGCPAADGDASTDTDQFLFGNGTGWPETGASEDVDVLVV